MRHVKHVDSKTSGVCKIIYIKHISSTNIPLSISSSNIIMLDNLLNMTIHLYPVHLKRVSIQLAKFNILLNEAIIPY